MEEGYEKLLCDYEPLIKKFIKRYSFAGDYEELFQVGRIALWEAYVNFDENKGYFPAYAKRFMNGRFLHSIKKNPFNCVEATNQIIDENHSYIESFLDSLIIKDYLNTLSGRERRYIEYVILKQGSLKNLAIMEEVSYETVKSWRKCAFAKLRMKAASLKT